MQVYAIRKLINMKIAGFGQTTSSYKQANRNKNEKMNQQVCSHIFQTLFFIRTIMYYN